MEDMSSGKRFFC